MQNATPTTKQKSEKESNSTELALFCNMLFLVYDKSWSAGEVHTYAPTVL
jgi:hypothetical protein